MKKLNKKNIIGAVQFFLLLDTSASGFLTIYSLMWFKLGLPIELWSILIIAPLALLSTGGLCHWIYKTGGK